MMMIEKMARAIAALSDDEWNSLPDTKADWRASRYPDCRYKDDFRDDARAALTALLEPSEGMVRAGLATEWPATYKEHLRHPDNGPVWALESERQIALETSRFTAAIQAALDERETVS